MFLCDQVLSFIEKRYPSEIPKGASRIALLKLEHLYYKNDSLYEKVKSDATTADQVYVPTKGSKATMDQLVGMINLHGTSKMKVRAALC